MSAGWDIWIDRGGTFTDVVARGPDGALQTRKLLSLDPARYADAALHAIRGIAGSCGAPVRSVRMGTTVATNALLERRGARVALVVTGGFRDLLSIGTQDRPSLFSLEIRKPKPLPERTIAARERVLAGGTVRTPLDEARLRAELEAARAAGIRAVAVCLLHSYAYPAHERRVGAIAREIGFSQISLSHQVSDSAKALSRGDTASVDAYLSPVLRAYMERVRAALAPATDLRFLQSDGGLARPDRFRGKDAVLSGPAGGAVACAQVARTAQAPAAIGFDMGGTSTDVSRVDLRRRHPLDLVYERRIAGVRVQAPSLDIQTVAAGGGSIVTVRDGRLQVGPESAGAIPGPAGYGRGGPPAVTDANLVLGRVRARHAPRCFGPSGDGPLDLEASRCALAQVAADLEEATGRAVTVEEAAVSALRVANEAMVKPIRALSLERGYDPREHALVCFGGAAPQHACQVAGALAMRAVIVPPLASLLSAWGMGLAETVHRGARAVLRPLDGAGARALRPLWAALEAEADAALDLERQRGLRLTRARTLDLRYRGVAGALTIDADRAGDEATDAATNRATTDAAAAKAATTAAWSADATATEAAAPPDGATDTTDENETESAAAATDGATDEADADALRARFEAAHRRRFGYVLPQHEVEIVTARLETRCGAASAAAPAEAPAGRPLASSQAVDVCPVWFFPGGRRLAAALPTPVFPRDELPAGTTGRGPALVVEPTTTTVVEPGWRFRVDAHDNLVLEPEAGEETIPSRATALSSREVAHRDPVEIELFNHRFMSVAEQMGVLLQQVAHSANIKERLDFSCAIFEGDGSLVANAPHIPVHLGAMGESVRAIVAARGDRVRPGETYATNDPYHGGSHLPDVTLVTPVFAPGEPDPASGAPSAEAAAAAAGAAAAAAPRRPLFWVASRGHHADIGGPVPGSMPPFSRTIFEEGIRFHDLLVVRGGLLLEDEVRSVLGAGPWPARDLPERLRDLRAQIAANRRGVEALHTLCREHGTATVARAMGWVRDNAEAAMRVALRAMPPGEHRFTDHLDDGARIEVSVRIAGGEAVVDFTGSALQLQTNLNAPRAVVLAAVLYAFRTQIARPIPLNAGCLAPIRVVIPERSLLSPRPPAAVVGGNVETSMRLVDALLGALGAQAASQGTMNNVTFGDAGFGYYETLGGGAGAGPGFCGADAVHSHMTNTRITDPEVLERRAPVVVRRFEVRRGSGGRGRWRGGDGLVREIEALAPLEAAVLSERRSVRPFGLRGGEPGRRGRNAVRRADRVEELPGKVALRLEAGDVLVVETPGGGGFGRAEE